MIFSRIIFLRIFSFEIFAHLIFAYLRNFLCIFLLLFFSRASYFRDFLWIRENRENKMHAKISCLTVLNGIWVNRKERFYLGILFFFLGKNHKPNITIVFYFFLFFQYNDFSFAKKKPFLEYKRFFIYETKINPQL